ncbi:glycosyltransferase family 69 protein [Xylona heveae TC161]|uniref:Glycosyltransferase family 69 protein n=1 Tax=Xylona heveae (strain CBS 132557 / TC161) TaxID=1328760 RepID=A0A164ZUL3_XYLHT|nr:glycosyltransferase family 69 protein [Xylona heveae TC161]KZF19548.1 glycosyltransferase family 69 protein [Xylona heveae TC161]
MWRQAHSYELLPTSNEGLKDPFEKNESHFYTAALRKTWCLCRDTCCALVSGSSAGRKLGKVVLIFIPVVVLALVVLTALFNPSYVHRPPHYVGANPHNEKVFIAANIVDAGLIRGAWGEALLHLIEQLGPENTYLSIYENDSGSDTREALSELRQKVKCRSTITSEHLPFENIPKVELPSGEKRTKRIEYLATVRNRAIQPLERVGKYTTFDKILFLNDVVFSPRDAADLLFSTNADSDGRAQYTAACALDFINPFKFYDTFASRDFEGFSMGVPFYPWFAPGKSRDQVLDGTDAVQVQSCWGGMVAFDAKWFQPPKSSGLPNGLDFQSSPGHAIYPNAEPPLRFRAEKELYWESSECCLIHADIQAAATNAGNFKGIYMNPFIRVAYDAHTHKLLETTRRFEKLYSGIHRLITSMAGLPKWNPRRAEMPGETVNHTTWSPSYHRFEDIEQVAAPGGFCGMPALQVLKKQHKPGEKMWERLPIPSR